MNFRPKRETENARISANRWANDLKSRRELGSELKLYYQDHSDHVPCDPGLSGAANMTSWIGLFTLEGIAIGLQSDRKIIHKSKLYNNHSILVLQQYNIE